MAPGLISMTKRNPYWALIAATSGLTAVTALSLIWPEAKARAYANRPPASIVLDFTFNSPELIVPMSTVTQVRQLSSCDDILATDLAITASVDTIEDIANACSELAGRILHGTPTLSIAHLVRSWGFRAQGLTEQAKVSLLAAHLTAPNEGWLAARRLRLFFEIGVTANKDLHHAAQQDAMVVLQDSAYHSLLPELYLSYPESRFWLQNALSDAEPRHLRRFVYLTNASLSTPGGARE